MRDNPSILNKISLVSCMGFFCISTSCLKTKSGQLILTRTSSYPRYRLSPTTKPGIGTLNTLRPQFLCTHFIYLHRTKEMKYSQLYLTSRIKYIASGLFLCARPYYSTLSPCLSLNVYITNAFKFYLYTTNFIECFLFTCIITCCLSIPTDQLNFILISQLIVHILQINVVNRFKKMTDYCAFETICH